MFLFWHGFPSLPYPLQSIITITLLQNKSFQLIQKSQMTCTL